MPGLFFAATTCSDRRFTTARVLVVEDDEATALLVSNHLRRHGHKTLTANSGAQAIAMLGEKIAPEIVVLDIGLPDVDGRDLLTKLRQMPGLENLAAIFLSARVDQADIETGRALGAQYLTKPFVLSALLGALAKIKPPGQEEEGW